MLKGNDKTVKGNVTLVDSEESTETSVTVIENDTVNQSELAEIYADQVIEDRANMIKFVVIFDIGETIRVIDIRTNVIELTVLRVTKNGHVYLTLTKRFFLPSEKNWLSSSKSLNLKGGAFKFVDITDTKLIVRPYKESDIEVIEPDPSVGYNVHLPASRSDLINHFMEKGLGKNIKTIPEALKVTSKSVQETKEEFIARNEEELLKLKSDEGKIDEKPIKEVIKPFDGLDVSSEEVLEDGVIDDKTTIEDNPGVSKIILPTSTDIQLLNI